MINLLKEGLTPEKLAVTVALGFIVGIFPLPVTTGFAVIVAFLFRLNLAAMQIVNYFVYPLQLALMIPFSKIGEKLLGAESSTMNINQITAVFEQGVMATLQQLWLFMLHSVFAWIVISIPVGFVFYYVALVSFRKLMPSIKKALLVLEK